MKRYALALFIMGIMVASVLAAGCISTSSTSSSTTPSTTSTTPSSTSTSSVSSTTSTVSQTTTTSTTGSRGNADQIPSATNDKGSINTDQLKEYVDSIPAGTLTKEETDGLLYMVEEEKLAHDVYTKLYEKWHLQIFDNIAQSESTHVNAVRMLLQKYNIPDPTQNEAVGQFQNPDLQALYNQLIAQGMKSEVDALKVGALIEETDIIDLQERIDQTNKLDIIAVYENLMKGSRNHLRAFVSQLEKKGVNYTPQVLTPDIYYSIINGETEKGTVIPTQTSTSATSTETVPQNDSIPVVVNENGTINNEELANYVDSLPTGNLSVEEANGLIYMVEEEKLAHDVYTKLYEKWHLQIFDNIAQSESTHVNAVRTLLQKYGLPDPTADEPVGVFQNPDLQALYNQLIEMGSKNVTEALKVGALIEETDIIDLQERIDQTNKVDIITTYENLMKGSRNHLRSFVSQLEKYGITYEPQLLSKDLYDSIIGSELETGGSSNGGNSGGNSNGNGNGR